MSKLHEMLYANAGEINSLEFYAEMTRLGYNKLLLDNALLGEIVATLISRHNEALRENARLQAKIDSALAIEKPLPENYGLGGMSEREYGFAEAVDEYRKRLTGGESE